MENTNSSNSYSRDEINTIIAQWKGSGKSKSGFCREQGIGYHRFNGWLRREEKRKAAKCEFIPLQIRESQPDTFAEIHFSNGSRVIFHQRVAATYLRSLSR